MLAILLQILKILGLILLGILVCLILLLLAVLFIPIRYRAKGQIIEKVFFVSGNISWLLHIVHLSFGYDTCAADKVKCILRVFGLKVKDFIHPKSKKEKAKSIKKSKKDTYKRKEDTELSKKAEPANNEVLTDKIELSDRTKLLNSPEFSEQLNDNTDDTSYKKKKSLIERIKEVIQNFIEKLLHIKYTIIEFIQNIKEKKKQLQYYISVLQDPEMKPAFSKCKKQLLKIWKNIKPKKLSVALKLGFEDPAKMGEVLAIFGMFIPILGSGVTILPDFEKAILEGEFELKGSITLFVFLQVVWVILFDEDIKRLKTQFTSYDGRINHE